MAARLAPTNSLRKLRDADLRFERNRFAVLAHVGIAGRDDQNLDLLCDWELAVRQAQSIAKLKKLRP